MKTRTKKRDYKRIRSPHSLSAIARRYADGEAIASIATDYGIDNGTVRNIARREGVRIRPRGRPESRR